MDKIKNKYEIILGFVTLVVSLSAFKDELNKISIDLGYLTINLAEYFLYCVLGFCLCSYLYIIEQIIRDTRIGNWKIFDYQLKFAYFLFSFILFTPILLILNVIFYNLNSLMVQNQETSNLFISILQVVATLLSTTTSVLTTLKLLKERKTRQRQDIEEQEIVELDNANKLFNDGYYSHSLLESYKVLETHLYKKIIEKDIRVSKTRFEELTKIALQEDIINQDDIIYIKDLRRMRNIAAHSDMTYTKNQAEQAIDFVKALIRR